MTEPSLLEQQALKRRDKLRALKRKRDADKPSEGSSSEGSASLPQPVFRSYKPADKGLEEHALPDAAPGDIVNQVKDQLEAAKTAVVIDELDITNLAPRKPDWDLKRDVAAKLNKLERRTQKAIAELIRERLRERQENLLVAVNVGTKDMK